MPKHLKLSDDEWSIIEQLAQQFKIDSNIPDSQKLSEVLKHLTEEKPSQELILIVSKYRNSCLKCNKTIDVGDVFFWVKGTSKGLCLDCYANNISLEGKEKLLFSEKMIKKSIKELESKYLQLKEEYQALADEVKNMTLALWGKSLYNEWQNFLKRLSSIQTPKEILEQIKSIVDSFKQAVEFREEYEASRKIKPMQEVKAK